MKLSTALITPALAALKAIVGAAVPFAATWASTGIIDERALGAAAITALLVYLAPNIKLQPAYPPDDVIIPAAITAQQRPRREAPVFTQAVTAAAAPEPATQAPPAAETAVPQPAAQEGAPPAV